MALPATYDFAGTGALSASWTHQTAGLTRDTDKGKGTNGFGLAYWNADAFNNDQYSQVVVNPSRPHVGPSVRNTSTNNAYFVQGNNGTPVLFRYSSGGFTNIKTFGSFADGDLIKLEVTGTTLKVYKNGAQTGTDTTDATLASGSAGIYAANTDSSSRMDDWEGGNTGGAAAALAGIAALVLTTASILTTAITMAGQAALAVTNASVLTTAIRFAGAAALSVTTAAADLATAIRLAGASALTITTAAAMDAAGAALAGAATLAIVGASALTTAIRFAGAAALSVTASSSLTTAITLSSAVTVTLTASGVMDVVGAALVGAATLALLSTGTLTTSIRFVGAAALVVLASGTMAPLLSAAAHYQIVVQADDVVVVVKPDSGQILIS